MINNEGIAATKSQNIARKHQVFSHNQSKVTMRENKQKDEFFAVLSEQTAYKVFVNTDRWLTDTVNSNHIISC